MQLLVNRLVELQVVEQAISDETVRRILKKRPQPWLKAQWCIPTVSSEFVWYMEDVLDLYAEPFDANYPQVCFDERPVQLLGGTYASMPMQKGQVRRYDYEYDRAGTANLFTEGYF